MAIAIFIVLLAFSGLLIAFQVLAVIVGSFRIAVEGLRWLRGVRFKLASLFWLTLVAAGLLMAWRLVPAFVFNTMALLGSVACAVAVIVANCIGINWLIELTARVHSWRQQPGNMAPVEPPG